MNAGIRTIIYPVKDISKAKALYSELLGAPHTDQPYYVGFRIEDQEIALDPNGHKNGMTMPVGFYHVKDLKEALQSLVDAGAQVQQAVRDVGGGKLVATVKDADGNQIGLLQEA